jgi:hypothetical protein
MSRGLSFQYVPAFCVRPMGAIEAFFDRKTAVFLLDALVVSALCASAK